MGGDPVSLAEFAHVESKLAWMEEHGIWPNGLRYLWTDAFGLVLYVSLYQFTGDSAWLDKAQHLVDEVYRILGRRRGLRIGEEADRDGQYFHYLIMWIYALTQYGRYRSEYRDEAIALVKQVHPRFIIPGVGVIWKMEEDLSGPYPGFGLGAMDAFDGYVIYRLLDEDALGAEVGQMRELVLQHYAHLTIDQDLGLGMMLWLCHYFPDEPWAVHQRRVSLQQLQRLWIDPPGYFCRQSGLDDVRFAFTNYGISLGLQACATHPEQVTKLNAYFATYRSNDEYDSNSITHVMDCTSHFPGLFLQQEH